MSIFCNHKYGAINSDGIQYCTKCGIAHQIELRCNHHYEKFDTLKTTNIYGGSHFEYVLQCKKCGVIKIVSTL